MDAKLKRSQSEKVRRRLTHYLEPTGFLRTRTSFWSREVGPLVQFIHLHLFSYTPAFRIHTGIRVLNESFEAAELNGPSCADIDAPTFDMSSESVLICGFAIFRYCQEIALPWFERWSDPEALASHPHSPLRPEARLALRAALDGLAKPENENRSRRILGVA